MRPFRAQSSGLAASSHMHSSVGSITTTSESEFSLHTAVDDAALFRGDPASDRGVVGAAASSLRADMIFGNDRAPFHSHTANANLLT